MADTLTAQSADTASVVGHTDSVGSDAYNQDLSERRAASVVRALEGLASDLTYQAEGRGESEPAADEDTPESQARNRRVTVTIPKGG